MSLNKYTNKMAEKASAFTPPKEAPEEEQSNQNTSEVQSFSDYILAEGGRRKERGKNSHTFYINDTHYRKIKDLADRSGLSTSEVINMILDKCL